MTAAPVVEKDIVYVEDGRPLRWDVYRTPGGEPRKPAAILLHGGGWRVGNRAGMANAASTLAQLGFVAIAAEYRLIGEIAWPVPLQDVRRAIRAVHAQASSLAIDPDHVFLVGYSAGAHLALLAASLSETGTGAPGQDSAVSGVAAFFPPARLGPEQARFLKLTGDDIAKYSPINHAALLPPTILLCGDADTIAPVSNSIDLHRAVRVSGATADLRIYAGLEHEFVSLPGMMDMTCREVAEFFRRTAIAKREFDPAAKALAERWANYRAQAAAGS
jgi:acetyl esterase/lipase